uniref:S-adenosyl-L-methionine-dependent tRNA 4-demethylwyosine synthase TYW1 n=2 Tax=Lygus hesperus TaxID=30085 RepID=A0A0A9WXI1_LYGHE
MMLEFLLSINFLGHFLIASVIALLIFKNFCNLYSAETSEPILPTAKRQQKENERQRPQSLYRNIDTNFRCIEVYFATEYGNTKKLCEKLVEYFTTTKSIDSVLIDLSNIEPEDVLHSKNAQRKCLSLFVLPTVTDGQPPKAAKWFCKWLSDAATDFRIDKQSQAHVSYAVFGLGNSVYAENFNIVAKEVDENLAQLGACRVCKLTLGDEDTSESQNGGLEADFDAWTKVIENVVWSQCTPPYEVLDTRANEVETSSEEEDVVDIEDLVKPKSKRTNSKSEGAKEMITPQLRGVLTKQGYKLIGSHSGVKLCRWTKSMMRGRGGCYKHTFYGIESHRCMETTPSLACANKCVFCWRHHSNPVGTEWKWKMDDANTILRGALENHYNMIKEFKGVPGVLPEKFAEALAVKHCALSLVGEPIMYPEINKFCRLLHEEGISTFLVTNAQFPEAIRAMDPVTQLYVSVDASTKESLKKIDRPLFKDFWERFIDSLKALSEKGQRTVYRLTLVKAWNIDEMQNYASLVALGKPDFIEVKGVTYCGGDSSKPNSLTMANVPWHEEVTSFVEQLIDLLPDYALASEHEHSNCLLIAHRKFFMDGKWRTWIDYTKFHNLMRYHYETKGESSFSAMDYVADTPSWATFGSVERGFDPSEKRWHRKNGTKDISGC